VGEFIAKESELHLDGFALRICGGCVDWHDKYRCQCPIEL
jgi:hypothetical protein